LIDDFVIFLGLLSGWVAAAVAVAVALAVVATMWKGTEEKTTNLGGVLFVRMSTLSIQSEQRLVRLFLGSLLPCPCILGTLLFYTPAFIFIYVTLGKHNTI
jgi:hypothetical protein